MLGNSIKYAEKAEESRQVGKIKKVLAAQATEFLPSYYAVLYYGKSYSGGLLKPEEYRKRWNRKEVIKTHSFIRRKLKVILVIFLPFGLLIDTVIMRILRATVRRVLFILTT